MARSKHRVFIGSSSESLRVAETLADTLKDEAEATIWNQGIFQLGQGTLESLVKSAVSFDFAVMVLGAEDLIRSRDEISMGPRDNVLFELGLFMGCLGPERTFMVYDADTPPRLPSDLEGITAATYSAREDGNLQAALNSATLRLKTAFDRLGLLNGRRKQRRSSSSRPCVYWCAPHRNKGRNAEMERFLRGKGIDVLMPYDLVNKEARKSAAVSPSVVRQVCVRAILGSDLVVVDLDTYGLDSAWEIGFAEGHNIPVVGFSGDSGQIVKAREVRRRPYAENFMHGWDARPVHRDLSELERYCEGKTVYVCGSFRNETAFEQIREGNLGRVARRILLPKDIIELGKEFPKNYPYNAREQAYQMLAESDVALVVVPRYGMDTSWQIGYADALEKEIVGWEADAFGGDSEEEPIWDHWMHGWKEKLTSPHLEEVAAIVTGLHQVNGA